MVESTSRQMVVAGGGSDCGGSDSGDRVEPVRVDAERVDEDSVVALLGALEAGKYAELGLAARDRRRCVEYLFDEGYSGAETSHMLKVSDRTVRRDRAAIRQAGAIEPGLKMGDELMGELERVTMRSIQRLRRLAGDTETPAYVRQRSEEACVRVYMRFIEAVKEMGYFSGAHARLGYLKRDDPEEKKRFNEFVRSGGM